MLDIYIYKCVSKHIYINIFTTNELILVRVQMQKPLSAVCLLQIEHTFSIISALGEELHYGKCSQCKGCAQTFRGAVAQTKKRALKGCVLANTNDPVITNIH